MTRTHASLRGALLTAQLACCICTAHAQAAAEIMLTLGAHEFPGADGNRVAVDVVHRDERHILHTGLERRNAGSTELQLIEFGGVLIADQFNFGAGIETGPGNSPGSDSSYTTVRMHLGLRQLSRWRLGLEDYYIDVEPVEGWLGTAAATRIWTGGSSISLKLAASHGGNLDEQSISARLDLHGPSLDLFAGLSTGVSNNRLLLDLPGTQMTTTRVRQGYLGIRVPLARNTASVVLEVADLDGLRRAGISVVLAFGIDAGSTPP